MNHQWRRYAICHKLCAQPIHSIAWPAHERCADDQKAFGPHFAMKHKVEHTLLTILEHSRITEADRTSGPIYHIVKIPGTQNSRRSEPLFRVKRELRGSHPGVGNACVAQSVIQIRDLFLRLNFIIDQKLRLPRLPEG